MAFAMTDNVGRIIEWSEEQLDGMTVEFSNGDYVNATAINGAHDFRIVDGLAVYDPTQETLDKIEAEELKTDKQEIMDSIPDALAELSLAVSDGAADTADLAEALADLSLIVSNLVEGV